MNIPTPEAFPFSAEGTEADRRVRGNWSVCKQKRPNYVATFIRSFPVAQPSSDQINYVLSEHNKQYGRIKQIKNSR